MNIIYIEQSSGLYYDEIFLEFAKNKKFNLQSNFTKETDFLILGPGYLCDENLIRNENIDIRNIKTKKVLFLNKEYKNLERKFDFINKNKIDVVFTVHQNFKNWNLKCPESKFYKIPFAFNDQIFKDYKLEKDIDIGFTGNLFNKGDYKNTNIMGENFNNVRERIFNVLKNSEKLKKYKMFLGEDVYLKGEDYGKTINKTKVWISTPSAIDIVGTRFYEVMGSNTLLFAKNIPGIYEDIIEPNNHFATFEDNLEDFEEKLIYFLENNSVRTELSKKGFEHAHKKHTWKNRIDTIFEILTHFREKHD